MPSDFLPKREADFLQWTGNFRRKIVISPQSFNLDAAQAAEYAATQQAFADAFALTSQPFTRTGPAIKGKNIAKAALEKLTRQLAAIVRASPLVSDVKKADLGLSIVQRGGYRPRLRVPDAPPALNLRYVAGRTVHVRLFDNESPSRRAKPRGCSGATLFTHIGPAAPASLDDWKRAGMSSEVDCRVQFDAAVPPGSQVWVCAQWFDTQGRGGPVSAPITVHLAGGVAKAA